MHSPEVLKAIYALEHGQSVDRMAQTLLQFGVTQAEIEVMLNDKGDEPALAVGSGIHWAPLAERIATERAARGWPVVSLEMLRRATTTSARVETVRIHAQNRRISLVGAPSAASPAPAPAAPPAAPSEGQHYFSRPLGGSAPVVAVIGGGGAAGAPRPAIVPVSKAPYSPAGAVPSSLLRDLERAAQLVMMHSGIEATLPRAQIETLRATLRTFLDAAEEIATGAAASVSAPPAVVEPRPAMSLGGRRHWGMARLRRAAWKKIAFCATLRPFLAAFIRAFLMATTSAAPWARLA